MSNTEDPYSFWERVEESYLKFIINFINKCGLNFILNEKIFNKLPLLYMVGEKFYHCKAKVNGK